jgi:hypothetical protein
MPLPAAKTSVLAVPRSMARSLENMLNSERKPCEREERDGYPFNDIGKNFYLRAYCTANSPKPYHWQAQAKEDKAVVRTNSVTIGTFGNLIFPVPGLATSLDLRSGKAAPLLCCGILCADQMRVRHGAARAA